MSRHASTAALLTAFLSLTVADLSAAGIVFPGAAWQTKTPAELGLDGAKLDQFASNIGGSGCVVKDGYMVKTWGNQSSKFESAFINVDIQQNHSVMLHSLAGSRLGIWVAHGEGRFKFPYQPEKYNIAAKYCYSDYPGNPNSSDWDVACIYSEDGRHLGLMPHLERSFFPWQWPDYPKNRKHDQITPWIEAFVNAREWVKNKIQLSIAVKVNH